MVDLALIRLPDFVRVKVRVANAADVSKPRQADSCVVAAMTKPGRHGMPDVILFSEVSTVDVERIGELRGWRVEQHGARGYPEAGTAIAIREDTMWWAGKGRLTQGTAATSEGGGIRARSWVRRAAKRKGQAGKLRLASGHAPPPRAGRARDRFLGTVRRLHGVVGGDMNVPRGRLLRLFRREVRAIGVLALIVPKRLHPSKAEPCDIGSDHAAVDVVLHVRRRRQKKEKA